MRNVTSSSIKLAFLLTGLAFCWIMTGAHSLDAHEPEYNRWLVVLCSLPGDDEHQEKMTQMLSQIHDYGLTRFGVAKERIRWLVGNDELAKGIRGSQICNRTNLDSLSTELKEKVSENDTLFFLVLGHAHLQDRSSQFNIEGPDVDQTAFAKLFGDIKSKLSVFWIATPASGYWIKSLSGSNHVVMAATEASPQITATEMPYALGKLLSGEGAHAQLEDIDKDGALSLFDLFVAVCIEVQQSFKAAEYLQTEHAQLDDNGDGKGGEVQESYLPKDEDDHPRRRAKPSLDGGLAKRILLAPTTK